MAIIRTETTTKVMRSKAAAGELLVRKALSSLRSRLMFLFFLASGPRRRRTAMAAAGHIRALAPRDDHRRQQGLHAAAAELAPSAAAAEEPAAALHGLEIAELLQQVLDEDDDGGYHPDWTDSMLDDEEDNCKDEDVDRAADLFIRRVRARINSTSF
ncbi:uncharacterized protein LOC112272043 [Brachypodium distachyon]|uniref:uncharacterized protein LOC112272043 n=1 Tax=Brachypodium distachyon TaxID=15368 RepID=UPI000D0CB4F0|nr:uncharacterized protein LOC112272043 [Brachypodium distachyon]|eukprot:XP_024318340.1 uncharacterized protein LOC112272043 [Brachypodium distachyon]